MNRNVFCLLGFGALVGGCTLMPEYERPNAPVADTWPSGMAMNNTTDAAPAETDWREFFDDPRLRSLIEFALENNRDLRIATLRVEQARAQYRIERSALFPGAQGSASMLRQKNSATVNTFNEGNIFTTYDVSIDAAYELDLFGRVRSLKRAALERYFATDEARKSAQIALVSEVAAGYLTLLQLREARDIAKDTLAAVEKSHTLNRRSFEAGVASELDLRTSEAQVQTTRVNLANYFEQNARAENALVLLVGGPLPTELPAGETLDSQRLLASLPAGLPSELLQQRPDILAAEHHLQAANADIGAARAAFFPRIMLTGSAGTASARLSDLFTGPSETWNFSPQITVPLFEAGSTRARLETSKLEKRIEVANYEKVIQTAFREVADVLAVRAVLDEKLDAQEKLLQAQQRRFELTEARHRQGVDSYLAVLLAQRDLYAARQNLLQYQAARLLNAVDLYRSLGGGWKS
jgi:multidrug efflux system outer membrane protein